MRAKHLLIITMAVITALFSAGCNSKVFKAWKASLASNFYMFI